MVKKRLQYLGNVAGTPSQETTRLQGTSLKIFVKFWPITTWQQHPKEIPHRESEKGENTEFL